MKLKIISFSGENFSHDSVISTSMMTQGGEITILDNHAPMIASMTPGVLQVSYSDDNAMKQQENFAIGSGVVEVSHSSVKVMVDMLIDVNKVDEGKAQEAKDRALKMMEEAKHSTDRVDMEKFIEAEDLLHKSIAQLKLYDLRK